MYFFTKPKPKKSTRRKSAKSTKLSWEKDAEIQQEMEGIIASLDFSHIKSGRVFCYRTNGSKAHAYARIWAFPKIFQDVLSIEPAYVMEIISEKFDKLKEDDKKKVIIHELLHIPKNFSGSLLPHKYGYTRIDEEVDVLFAKYKQNRE
jgi:predicted metallopeptidase